MKARTISPRLLSLLLAAWAWLSAATTAANSSANDTNLTEDSNTTVNETNVTLQEVNCTENDTNCTLVLVEVNCTANDTNCTLDDFLNETRCGANDTNCTVDDLNGTLCSDNGSNCSLEPEKTFTCEVNETNCSLPDETLCGCNVCTAENGTNEMECDVDYNETNCSSNETVCETYNVSINVSDLANLTNPFKIELNFIGFAFGFGWRFRLAKLLGLRLGIPWKSCFLTAVGGKILVTMWDLPDGITAKDLQEEFVAPDFVASACGGATGCNLTAVAADPGIPCAGNETSCDLNNFTFNASDLAGLKNPFKIELNFVGFVFGFGWRSRLAKVLGLRFGIPWRSCFLTSLGGKILVTLWDLPEGVTAKDLKEELEQPDFVEDACGGEDGCEFRGVTVASAAPDSVCSGSNETLCNGTSGLNFSDPDALEVLTRPFQVDLKFVGFSRILFGFGWRTRLAKLIGLHLGIPWKFCNLERIGGKIRVIMWNLPKGTRSRDLEEKFAHPDFSKSCCVGSEDDCELTRVVAKSALRVKKMKFKCSLFFKLFSFRFGWESRLASLLALRFAIPETSCKVWQEGDEIKTEMWDLPASTTSRSLEDSFASPDFSTSACYGDTNCECTGAKVRGFEKIKKNPFKLKFFVGKFGFFLGWRVKFQKLVARTLSIPTDSCAVSEMESSPIHGEAWDLPDGKQSGELQRELIAGNFSEEVDCGSNETAGAGGENASANSTTPSPSCSLRLTNVSVEPDLEAPTTTTTTLPELCQRNVATVKFRFTGFLWRFFWRRRLAAVILKAVEPPEHCIFVGDGEDEDDIEEEEAEEEEYDRRRLTAATGTIVQATLGGLPPGTSASDVSTSLQTAVMSGFASDGSLTGLAVTGLSTTTPTTTTTTTTSEMPWGLPWWAWFLICCGSLLLCLLCCGFFGGGAGAAGLGGKKKSKSSTETVYEVVEEPDAVAAATYAVPLTSSSYHAVPTASSVVPLATTATAYAY